MNNDITLQVGVKALIKNDKNDYLFLRRSNTVSTDTNETSWDVPGGRINFDESLIDGLTREIQEEVGHTIQSTPRLIKAQDIFVASKNLHVVRLTYIIDENISSIELSGEHSEYKWISAADCRSVNAEPFLAEVLSNL